MAQSHTWFATTNDVKLILEWLRNEGAEIVGKTPFPTELPSDGREWIVHFPSIGPLEFWPDEIYPSDYPENSARWLEAVLLLDNKREEPDRPWLDADRSAAAGLRVPGLREDTFWVAGELWFPGSRLRKTFPALANLCSRFQRWIRLFPTVFDNTKGMDKSCYSHQLCMSGVLQRVVALPEAESLLSQGACMVDNMVSPRMYRAFKIQLEISGGSSPP